MASDSNHTHSCSSSGSTTKNTKRRKIFINMDNCLYRLDQVLYERYCEKFGKKIPSPLEMMRKPAGFHLEKGDQYKLSQILMDRDFFSKEDLTVDNTKGILLEVYQYEEKYKTIDFKLFTTLNPVNSSVYFKRIPQISFFNDEVSGNDDGKYSLSIDRDECIRIMTTKINWVCKLLGHKKNWLNKIMFLEEDLTNETSSVLNCADLLILGYPLVSELNATDKNQEIIIIKTTDNQDLFKTGEWNKLVESSRNTDRTFSVMKGWKDWKKSWNLEFSLNDFLTKFEGTSTAQEVINSSAQPTAVEVPFYHHGSKDSSDVDIIYIFKDKLPPENDCNLFIRASGTEDRNLVLIRSEDYSELKSDTDKGYLVDVFKGLVDEANNALFTTYPLHEQKYPCQIRGRVRRLVPLKVCMTLVNLIGKVRRCKEVRSFCIKALNVPSFKLKRLSLAEMDFTKLTSKLHPDDLKFMAFRLGQTLALVLYGCELYSKSEISEFYPELKAHLYRDENVSYAEKLEILEKYKKIFVESISCVDSERQSFVNVLYLNREELKKIDRVNYFHLQANGFVCDLKDKFLKCFAYPFDDFEVWQRLKTQTNEISIGHMWNDEGDATLPEYTPPSENIIPLQVCYGRKEGTIYEYYVSMLDAIYQDEDERNGVPISEERLNNPKQQLLRYLASQINSPYSKEANIPYICHQITLLDFNKYFYLFEYDKESNKLVNILLQRSKLTNCKQVVNSVYKTSSKKMKQSNSSHILCGDIITVIMGYLPLDEQLRSLRVCSDWFRAIQSMQFLFKQALIDFLKIDQIFGMNTIITELEFSNNSSTNSDEYLRVGEQREEVDWLRILQLQFAKLPKKIKTGIKEINEEEFSIKSLSRENYGNVDLVKDWNSPFDSDPISMEIGDVRLPHSVSFYEFPFDLRSEIIEKYNDSETVRKKLTGIYVTCLVYELLSVGDYVPNLYNDIIRVIPSSDTFDELCLDNFTLEESIAAVLLCTLQENGDEILERWFKNDILLKIKLSDVIYVKSSPHPVPSQVTPSLLMESIRRDGLSSNIQLCPNIEIVDLRWLSLSDIETIKNKLQLLDDHSAEMKHLDHYVFPLYYNAGGGSYDIVNVMFNIEEDGRIVKLVREESRTYY
ncbi:hypothetical protein NAEGRDRAFT_57493 [Naegleria gruberi]|uniref:F-box domain-containing protein n=1 Tax=Naegleria gruberi TaxID=5762 RepID=D2V8U8_NAEGR|nr:uncharacterized protein NAEGRDRAFT_57493 [Naegleria gruberi]EFC46862.1 hypothetical protein NAEGRDRAFT_57493 [Naegleria gruberi]|eukprot:XP_002679606.1 hypothetical protein NAEGRDRAFT_57493 [Naegleria gruberi strain NEG-M]